jgi:hypothetical protein
LPKPSGDFAPPASTKFLNQRVLTVETTSPFDNDRPLLTTAPDRPACSSTTSSSTSKPSSGLYANKQLKITIDSGTDENTRDGSRDQHRVEPPGLTTVATWLRAAPRRRRVEVGC